jgi:quercetin dioxygenase-like cupin family protein
MTSVPDVLVAAERVYRLLYENDAVRVMEIRLKPGETAPMHHHPAPHVVYVKNEARVKFTFPDGKAEMADLKAGQVLWTDAGPHEALNVGDTVFNNVVVEVKS